MPVVMDLPGGIYLVAVPAEVLKKGDCVAEDWIVSPMVGLLIISIIAGGMWVKTTP